MKTPFSFIALFILASLVGCKPDGTDRSNLDSSNSTESVLSPEKYSGNEATFLTNVTDLIAQYNADANGTELSKHGVNGQLDEDDAKTMADFANSIIKQINNKFDKPVCRTIGDSWYQVPSRFKVVETTPFDGSTTTFTISHHNCGLYEFDFIVESGSGVVVGDPYDDLDIEW